jgi:hydrogenase nickel incorporation protein HypA/HybF
LQSELASDHLSQTGAHQMHEFGIAERILNLVLDEAHRHNMKKVSTIRVQVGEANHLSADSLEFAFGIVSKNTIAQDAHIEMQKTDGLAIQVVNFDGE